MYPAVRTMTILAIITLAVTSMTGCGEKRIHVATLSGSPGDTMGLDGDTQAPMLDTQGIKSDAVDESNLDEGLSTTDSQPTVGEAALSLAEEPSATPSETKTDSMPDSTTGNGGDGFPLQEGSSLEAQSGSSPQATTSSTFGDLPKTSFSDLGEGAAGTANASSPNSSFDPSASEASSQMESFQPGNSNVNNSETNNMEEIPGTLQVAKAEPSDTLQEQLEHMKSQELAAAAAGLEDVFFQFDSWMLTGEGKQALERNMGWLKNDPSVSLLIEGHADQRGTQAYNMILGKKRAVAIRDYLNELGVDHNRLSVISYGKDKPFCQDPTEVCYQLNRRGHLLVQSPQ